MGFLKNLFPEKEIKTEVGYSYSNTAKMIVVVKTKDKEKIEKAISYVLSKKFPYKTGINIADIRFVVSKETLKSVKDEMFKEALREVNRKNATVNEILGWSYKVFLVKLSWQSEKVYRDYKPLKALPLREAGKPPTLELSKGSKKIRLNVFLKLGKKF